MGAKKVKHLVVLPPFVLLSSSLCPPLLIQMSGNPTHEPEQEPEKQEEQDIFILFFLFLVTGNSTLNPGRVWYSTLLDAMGMENSVYLGHVPRLHFPPSLFRSDNVEVSAGTRKDI